MENSNRENTHLLGYIFSLNSVMKTLSVKNNFFPDEGRKLEKSVWRLQKKQAGENSLKKKKKKKGHGVDLLMATTLPICGCIEKHNVLKV